MTGASGTDPARHIPHTGPARALRSRCMQVTVNGESCDLPEGLRADELIERIGLADQRIALEVNREIVPRSEYASTTLHEGDRVEIVRAIGGG